MLEDETAVPCEGASTRFLPSPGKHESATLLLLQVPYVSVVDVQFITPYVSLSVPNKLPRIKKCQEIR